MSVNRILCLTAAAVVTVSAGCKCCDQCNDKGDKPAAKPAAQSEPAPAPKAYATNEDTKPITYQDTVNASVTAKVVAVDASARLITLRGSSGVEESFRVDPSVQRLGEIRAGDTVAMHYRANLLAELRPPTSGETANPISYVDVTGRAPRTQDPAGVSGQAVRIVTTVESVDVPNMLVTLRGPLGDLVVVKGRNTDNLKRIKRGDTIVITYSQTTAISVDKAD